MMQEHQLKARAVKHATETTKLCHSSASRRKQDTPTYFEHQEFWLNNHWCKHHCFLRRS